MLLGDIVHAISEGYSSSQQICICNSMGKCFHGIASAHLVHASMTRKAPAADTHALGLQLSSSSSSKSLSGI